MNHVASVSVLPVDVNALPVDVNALPVDVNALPVDVNKSGLNDKYSVYFMNSSTKYHIFNSCCLS